MSSFESKSITQLFDELIAIKLSQPISFLYKIKKDCLLSRVGHKKRINLHIFLLNNSVLPEQESSPTLFSQITLRQPDARFPNLK